MADVVKYDPELRHVVDFGHHLSLIPLENDADPAEPYVSLLELPDEKDVRGSGRLSRFEYFLGLGGVNLGGFTWIPEEQSDLYFSFHHYLGYSHATHFTKPLFTGAWSQWPRTLRRVRETLTQSLSAVETLGHLSQHLEGYRFEARVDLVN